MRLKINVLPNQYNVQNSKGLPGMGALVAVVNKNDEDATSTAVTMLNTLKMRKADAFGIASPTTVKIESSINTLQDRDLNSPIVIGHAFSKILPTDTPQPVKLGDATFIFEGRIYPPAQKLSDAQATAEKLQQSPEEAIRKLTRKARGDFSLVLAEPEKIIVGRDITGIRPLYYGENENFVALASERKALWTIGIENASSFPPGRVACADGQGFEFDTVRTLAASKPRQITMQAAAKTLRDLLERSTRERVVGLKEIAVAFSGGLDSSIIAFLAQKSSANVHLIHVSLRNEPETEQAKKTAEELELPIHVCLRDEKDVEKTFPKILQLVEEPDPVKMSIGVPFYWTAERTAEMGISVMLAGQGADELFGGYKRYADEYSRNGSEKVQQTMFADVAASHEINFERDLKICNFHNIELRLPFATYQIAKFATNLPVELKIRLPDDGLRKLVLRKVAKDLRLPESVVEKPKKAIQYATGVNRILEKLARSEGMSIREYTQRKFDAIFRKKEQND